MGSCKSVSKVEESVEGGEWVQGPRIRHLNIEVFSKKSKISDIRPGLFVIREANSVHEDTCRNSLDNFK